MQRPLIITAALFAALAIVIGAFGAHGLKELLGPEQKAWFEKGVQYHQLAAVGALLMAVLADRDAPADGINGFLLLGGAAIFSGTLYLMALGAPRWLGAVTPIGGTLMIAAWVRFAWQYARNNHD